MTAIESQAEPTTETLTLPISGMSCAACQVHVERALREVPGVSSAEVSLLANRATVRFNPATTKPKALLQAVEEAGYEAALPAHANAAASEEDAHLLPRAILALAAASVSMVLSMPLMMATDTPDPLLSFVNELLAPQMPAALMHLPAEPIRWLLLVVTLAVMLFASPQTYLRAWQAARHRATNMNTLVAIGTLAAFAYSATATVAPGVFTRHGLTPDVYFEAVSFILAFLLLGSVLDARARTRTQAALTGFASLQAPMARVLRDGVETDLPIAQLHPGDTIQLRPGERIPVDGVVLTGSSTVDESLLTGESRPVLKEPGATVIGGTINLDGPLTLRATTLGEASVLAQLQRLLADAQASRAPMQALADRASAIFVPIVLALALLAFTAWLVFAPDHGLPRAFGIAIAVLVIACPCAMGLAVPAALTVGIGRAAQLGFLVKNGEVLERLAQTDTVALDKTGTLTLGQPSIVSATFTSDRSRDELLALAAALEAHSEHPLARAVLAYAGPRSLPPLTAIKTIPGHGITAIRNGQPIAIGNETLLRQLGVSIATPPTNTATSSLYLALDGRHVLTLEAEDILRPTASTAIQQLRQLHIAPLMLTGDNPATAAAIARQAGLIPAETLASLLPADKLAAIQSLQRQGHIVAMAGDGLNDAAALAQADTGLAISSGSAGTDLTRDAAGLLLLTPDLTAIPTAIRLARRTVRTMRQNLGWAVAYNVIGIPIAAGALYPAFHILLSPILASAAMALSSTSVLLNSLRLHRFR
jgi:Cu+-exporting ATPase